MNPSQSLNANRRRLIAALPWMILPVSTTAAAQQDFPNRPVRVVVPFPAGGATDLIARAIADRVNLGGNQPIVIDNKAGAGGTIGSSEVAKAPADGHVLLVATSSTHSIAPLINPRLPYQPEDDFTPIAHIADAASVVLVPASLPVNSIAQFIAYAKARPGRLNYASSGNATVVHLMTEAFKAQAGVFITHIPYRGTALAMPDLVAGQVHVLFDSLVSGLPQARDGKVKALAVTGKARSPLAPEIPTIAESGLPGFEATTWFGLYGPKGMAPGLVKRINAAFAVALQSAEVKERLAKLGAEPAAASTPSQFAELVRADRRRWAGIVKDRHITVD